MEMNEINEIAKSLDKEKAVSLFNLLKEGKYFAFLKEILKLLWKGYGKYIKGKSITIGGKKISLTAIIVAVLGVYAVLPSADKGEEKTTEQLPELTEAQENVYDKDGLKVYGFERCDQAICGLLENVSDKTFNRVIISVTFDDRQKNVLDEGAIDATNITPNFKAKLKIPSNVDFYSFTLTDVTVE